MKIVVAGGTGLLGSALVSRLEGEGHDVRVLTRRPRAPKHVAWQPDGSAGSAMGVVNGADAVVNLAGESIAAGRWTAARKARILDSRVAATRSLVKAIRAAAQRPSVFVSGSAVGYYGPHGDEPLTEEAPAGTDFLATVCTQWEAEAKAAETWTRVIRLRTGLVLDDTGGALPRIVLPFRLFAGGPVGSGRQYWSWIHIADWVGIAEWAIATRDLTGPVNATAPAPVTNREFAKTVGRVLHRPAVLPTPSLPLRVLLGEMADALLLTGQRVLPARAQQQGYHFRFPTLEPALSDVMRRDSRT